MNIIILTKEDRVNKSYYKISDDRFLHIKNVLKSKINDVIEIGLLNKFKGTARIIKISESEIILEVVNINPKQKKIFEIDIICALPRPQTIKKVLAISAAMGVNNLHFIRSEKVEKSYFDSPVLKKENYTKFLIEGLSQGKRIQLPKVLFHKKFKQFFEEEYLKYSNEKINLLAHVNENKFLSQLGLPKNKSFTIAIGPEGGWNNFEVNFMQNLGFIPFKVSNNVLRVEYAVNACLAQLEMFMSTL